MDSLTFDAANSVYTFETSELKGAIRAQSPDPEVDIRHGISELVHKPSGVSIIHPKYSALNLFRLFATHSGLGEPRLFERSVSVDGNTLTINWGPADEHFARIEAVYQIKEPNLIDLTITVSAEATYESYEIFLSNYFDPPLLAHVCLATERYTKEPDEIELIAPQENPVFKGVGLVYTRDAHAARRCVDGRWERKEMGHPTAQFRPQREYAVPMAFQADMERRVAAVLMSRPEDCFAVTSGYNTDDPEDAWKAQNPLYLSLFGSDFVPGTVRTAHVRLAITDLDDTKLQPMALYREFLAEVG
jgi:hypothetical protein